MDRTVALGDGAETRLESWGSAGPIVLCVHGITSSRRSWSRLGETLAPDYSVYAYDQRGHGDSARVLGPMTLQRSVADLGEVALALPGPVDLLIGHSWGGAVAILGGRSILVRKVLAIDPMIRVLPGTFESEYVDDLRPLCATHGAERERGIRAMYEGAHSADVEAKVHSMLPMSIEALERLGRENDVDSGGWDIRKEAAAYPHPLLILAAGVDSVMSPDDLAFIRTQGGPNVTLRIVEGQGHNLHRDAFERFVEEVRTFA
jgi:pimeloyl-ACP methyl ester carboxylesterase